MPNWDKHWDKLPKWAQDEYWKLHDENETLRDRIAVLEGSKKFEGTKTRALAEKKLAIVQKKLG